MSVIHDFKQIFRPSEKAPPSPADPTVLGRGWGSSGYFQPEALSLVLAMKQWELELRKEIQVRIL
jgi:hypothetical protein